MLRVLLTLAAGLGAGLGAGAGAMHAPQGQHGQDGRHGDGERVKILSVTDIVEKLDGESTAATTVEVTIEPGQEGAAHRHPGPGFGYVIEGEYELAIDNQPSKIVKAGETFYEPGGCLHRISRNPGKVRTRLLAVVVHPRDKKEVAVPEPAKR